ncbi:MAG: hypothetical protein HQ517_15630 [SAR324 cluster bacterium]|nr:hypothetical protein [SAR324 cluster bacterium]
MGITVCKQLIENMPNIHFLIRLLHFVHSIMPVLSSDDEAVQARPPDTAAQTAANSDMPLSEIPSADKGVELFNPETISK